MVFSRQEYWRGLPFPSLVDFAYSTAVTPKVMAGFLTGDEAISYKACAAQLFFFAVFLITESFLLASMAYDRHAAVCKPLHYTNIMTARVCSWMVVGAYVLRFLEASVHTWNIFSLSFCRSRVIDHFFCDATPVLALSCSDSNRSEMVFFILAGFNIISSVLSSWSLTCLSLSPFWGCAHLKDIRRPFPPVLPTSPPSPSSM